MPSSRTFVSCVAVRLIVVVMLILAMASAGGSRRHRDLLSGAAKDDLPLLIDRP